MLVFFALKKCVQLVSEAVGRSAKWFVSTVSLKTDAVRPPDQSWLKMGIESHFLQNS
jgi:hypothetical protein